MLNMRYIKRIVIHTSASTFGDDIGAKEIDKMHRKKGWNGIGYHYVIRLDGSVELGRAIEEPGAHVKGYNTTSIGICYIGGLCNHGEPYDTRTDAQKSTMKKMVANLKALFPKAEVLGHRDLSPDKNNDGKITSNEWLKQCPCFDVKKELK